MSSQQYTDDRLEEARTAVHEFIDKRFDTLGVALALKSEMEDYVDEPLRTAAGGLRESLSGSRVRVILDD